METGGYKGRSRTLHKTELHSCSPTLSVSRRPTSSANTACANSVPRPTTTTVVHPKPAARSVSPHGRASQIISPETGREVPPGETGLIRVFDLANVYSAMAIQTQDLGVHRTGGFELLGRAVAAEPRGCSLMSTAS